jgi:hypothetical protein
VPIPGAITGRPAAEIVPLGLLKHARCLVPDFDGASSRSVATVRSTMNLTLEDVALLKQLKAAGESGRTIREYNMRLALDRLAKSGYVVARPTGPDLIHYRITGRGQEALAEHD